MAERKDLEQFLTECGGGVSGYSLRDGQSLPVTYDDLTAFIGDRLGIEGEVTIPILGLWLLNSCFDPKSCSPEIDTDHVEAVMHIGELPDADEYVASLPDDGLRAVMLPPPHVVRDLINTNC